MTCGRSEDVTTLLARLKKGDESALERLMETVYADLRAMAQGHMDREFGPGHAGVTLQPTALANETYMRLIRQRQTSDNRGQFFAIATKVMIRALMDYHRRRKTAKRGGGAVRVSMDVGRQAAAKQCVPRVGPGDGRSRLAVRPGMEEVTEDR